MKAYLAGPMRGKPDNNFPAFMEAAKRLRAAGLEVFNPAEQDIEKGYSAEKACPIEECAVDDVKNVLQCDLVAVLPGWEASRMGAVEVLVALACDPPKPIVDAMTGVPMMLGWSWLVNKRPTTNWSIVERTFVEKVKKETAT